MNDVVSAWQQLKISLIAASGLSRDALHMYVGMAALLMAASMLRRPLQSLFPWVVVLAVAVVLELPDLRDNLLASGRWDWRASLHDVLNTVFWPTMLLLFARWKYGPA